MFGIRKNFISSDYFQDLKNEIKFNQDEVIINGIPIKEERLTAWMTDNN